MKSDKSLLTIVGISYAVLLTAAVMFYLMNPFHNKCVSGDCSNGKGVFHYHSGMKYEGEWEDGLKHGKGTLIYPRVYKYTGEWKNNRKDGWGVQIYRRGAHYIGRYEGEWESGRMHGRSRILYQSGIAFEGNVVYGKRAEGILTYPDGRRKGIP